MDGLSAPQQGTSITKQTTRAPWIAAAIFGILGSATYVKSHYSASKENSEFDRVENSQVACVDPVHDPAFVENDPMVTTTKDVSTSEIVKQPDNPNLESSAAARVTLSHSAGSSSNAKALGRSYKFTSTPNPEASSNRGNTP